MANGIHITYYEFEAEKQAKAASQSISNDKNKVGNAYINWGLQLSFIGKEI